MCEHVDAIKNLDAILRTPGIDVLHIVANDLAQSMGFPPETQVREAMLGAIGKARAAGIGAGVGGNNPGDAASVAALVKAGANFVTISASGLLRLGAEHFRSAYDSALG